ncbi:MAG: hypothetical protein OEW84_01905 [Aigarchaeota archaeon]|nr:hypothetical protein [Aigarchaeota archaeon]
MKAYLEPADIPVGHEAKVTVMVLNRGDLAGTGRIGVRARMGTRVEAVGEEAVTLDGGQEKTLLFMFKPSEVGKWKVAWRGQLHPLNFRCECWSLRRSWPRSMMLTRVQPT